jgi:hypothetical protein
MREVCEQCQRFIPYWTKATEHEGHLFCSETCAEHHEIVEDYLHGSPKPLGCYQIPAPHRPQELVGSAW